jgi:hypothetical protein
MKRDGQMVRILERQTLADGTGKLISVKFEQRTRKGDRQIRKHEIYDNGNSAVILPYDPDRKTVLLARQLRLPIFFRTASKDRLRRVQASSTARPQSGG